MFSKVVDALSEVGKREEECRLVEDETEKMLSHRGGADYLQVWFGRKIECFRSYTRKHDRLLVEFLLVFFFALSSCNKNIRGVPR